MRTTITLSDDVYQAAKTLAEGSGRTLGEVISDLLRRALRPQSDPKMSGRFPCFSVPANAEIIPGNRAHELQDEEGAE